LFAQLSYDGGIGKRGRHASSGLQQRNSGASRGLDFPGSNWQRQASGAAKFRNTPSWRLNPLPNVFSGPHYFQDTLDQMDQIGVGSLPIVLLTGFLLARSWCCKRRRNSCDLGKLR